MGDRMMMRRIRRPRLRWLAAMILAAAVIGAAVGVWAGTRIAPTYAASSSILVGNLDRPSLANDFSASGTIATLYGDLIRQDLVLQPVIDRLGLSTDVQELRDRVHVDIDPNGIPIITITVYARSAAEATSTAQAITERMAALSRGALAGTPLAPPTATPLAPPTASATDPSDLQVSITRVERKLARLHTQATSVPPKRRGPIERRIERQSGLLMLLQDDYRRTARVAVGSANQLQVLQPAEAKAGRIRPLTSVDAALGAMIWALAGCAAFVAMTMRRRSGVRPSPPGPTLVHDAWARELATASHDA
jgi:hypothetical protein